MIRTLIVDDHDMIRMGLSGILSAEPDMVVCGTASEGAAGVSLARAEAPDVVLMDLSMPGMDGIEATRRIAQLCPHARVLVLSGHLDPETVRRAMCAGASGYLVKGVAPDALVEAVRAVHRGEQPLAPDAASALEMGQTSECGQNGQNGQDGQNPTEGSSATR